MITVHHVPRAPLSDFVRLLWYWDGYRQPHAHERILPDGSMNIVFDLSSGAEAQHRPAQQLSPKEVIAGARSTFMVVDTAAMVTTLGINFKPGGAFPFLRMPASELNEQCIALDDVFGTGVRNLREWLLESATPEAKFAVAEQWLLSQLAKPLEKHPAVEYATGQFLRDSVTQPLSVVLGRVGYSQRHFNQLFTNEVGLTPKRFLRVRRFQRVITSIAHNRRVDLADLALHCGYYDQSHFAHDFRSFSGLSPVEYLSRRTPHLNHVPLLD